MPHAALVTIFTDVDSDSVRDRGDETILHFPLSLRSEYFLLSFLPLMPLNRLSDFYPAIILPRLRQFSLASYDFCPIPRIHYVGLNKEIYVHESYLKNFCDEVKFPNWPVGEPLVFLRCVMYFALPSAATVRCQIFLFPVLSSSTVYDSTIPVLSITRLHCNFAHCHSIP